MALILFSRASPGTAQAKWSTMKVRFGYFFSTGSIKAGPLRVQTATAMSWSMHAFHTGSKAPSANIFWCSGSFIDKRRLHTPGCSSQRGSSLYCSGRAGTNQAMTRKRLGYLAAAAWAQAGLRLGATPAGEMTARSMPASSIRPSMRSAGMGSGRCDSAPGPHGSSGVFAFQMWTCASVIMPSSLRLDLLTGLDIRHRRKRRIRRLPCNRRPVQLALVLRPVERRRAVQRAAVVPHHRIAVAPRMAVDELRLGAELGQLVE